MTLQIEVNSVPAYYVNLLSMDLAWGNLLC